MDFPDHPGPKKLDGLAVSEREHSGAVEGHAIETETGDDLQWAERNAYWQEQAKWRPRGPRDKRRVRNPLVLGGHGVRLRIDRGSLLVQNGFTHHPQKREEWRFFPGHPDLPSRIVVVDASGSITFDVLAWLSAQAIPLIQLNWRGESIVVAGPTGFVADPKRVEQQRRIKADPKRRMAVGLQLVKAKIAATLQTLDAAIPAGQPKEIAVREAQSSLEQLGKQPPDSESVLRGIEGRVAQAYFRSWRSIELQWDRRKPVPDEWRRIGPRVSANRQSNRNATHPVNAMLNYGYALLETHVRMTVVGAGYDPYIGFFHGQWRGKQGLVLDLMEPLRPRVDESLLQYCQSQQFHMTDFLITDDGTCRITPQLARAFVDTITKRTGSTSIINLSRHVANLNAL